MKNRIIVLLIALLALIALSAVAEEVDAVAAQPDEAWLLMLVNRDHPIPEDLSLIHIS